MKSYEFSSDDALDLELDCDLERDLELDLDLDALLWLPLRPPTSSSSSCSSSSSSGSEYRSSSLISLPSRKANALFCARDLGLIESDSDSDGGAGGRTGLGSSAGRVAGGSLCGLAPTEGDGVDGATPLPGAGGAGEFFFRGRQQDTFELQYLTLSGRPSPTACP